jgi:hypothetical protein
MKKKKKNFKEKGLCKEEVSKLGCAEQKGYDKKKDKINENIPD